MNLNTKHELDGISRNPKSICNPDMVVAFALSAPSQMMERAARAALLMEGLREVPKDFERACHAAQLWAMVVTNGPCHN